MPLADSQLSPVMLRPIRGMFLGNPLRLGTGDLRHRIRTVAAALAVHRPPVTQGDVRSVGQNGALGRQSRNQRPSSGQVLEADLACIDLDGHLLPRDLWVGNDYVAFLAAAEDGSRPIQSKSKDFLTSSKEHQLRHMDNLRRAAFANQRPGLKLGRPRKPEIFAVRNSGLSLSAGRMLSPMAIAPRRFWTSGSILSFRSTFVSA